MEEANLILALGTVFNPEVIRLIVESVLAARMTGRLDMAPVLERVQTDVPRLEQRPKTGKTFPFEFLGAGGEKSIVQVPCMDVADVPEEAWGKDIVIY